MDAETFKFKLEGQDPATSARAGKITTSRGEIETPVFMPVGTAGAVKTLCSEDLLALDAKIILSNTYHLVVRPGLDVIEKAGGLHKFMNWNRPILTDSGGYQVFSLKETRKVTDEGVEFRSHVNGDKLMFTPESVIAAQKTIGSDIIMPFDECVMHPCPKDDAAKAMVRTHEWLARSMAAHEKNNGSQALFGIVQGSVHPDLREESAKFIAAADVAGSAIGGLSVGEPAETMYAMLDCICPHLPQDKPRYLMGVGTPENIVEAVSRGVDMFDCVIPTRNARNGQVFTSRGRVHYKAGEYKNSADIALDPDCGCFVCKNYSRAYLRHLFNANEITALRLATYHNLYFYLNMMQEIRAAIVAGNFAAWRKTFLAGVTEENH
ncbi:MAG: tRNA guanosine(34) transglycosylase Tgt [Candidatus Raymondbacteria bacterium RifOxyA12_full_50_37]|uniref:Queuine tRNA-ribosyltransferase n=1 Tax=Candidatus Raymondbacteria bacterium RIFOXYD12_FULL_49_13 TaxID=1817890 RepID=A0A1F7FFE5_UNCRA|nr:MAG: tRNA guanosine(34) transglycosylase Tgt [Candidatus Raymondbacteria bacterium RifOxyA12_full_50_37]OGJ94264.1 MAG: tRNA guanosine(34) transglycosylase Tgt [Candidatus Raymondbacteria bacterium RIFOXYA2_FULL_49_16]OGJ96377.1 MAG: tRNA guanosine(34) transglycosylase Tgt [Candidatus Raymondbacteria bacterium RifOxyC12_full_50_8]OGJ99094.1 MAG: tRNA guanosine(34) transglycosylase Tgt [Candidatus Raymondbacteria bacterium RIFOXYC2_FULL_50_21]OGK01192.1 MAG: tRNA guanosine(34) transglycosylas